MDMIFKFIFNIIKMGLPIVLIFALGMIFKIIRQYSKYGSRVFDSFKYYPIVTEYDLIAGNLKMIDAYQRIFKTKDSLIIINKSGIYLIHMFSINYSISGNITSDYFLINKKKKIKNPFNFLNQEAIELEKKLNRPITKIMVINDTVFFDIKGNKDINIVYFNKIYYFIDSRVNKYSIYTIDEIDVIGELYGNNKNEIH